MIRIISLFLLFTISPILSANNDPNGHLEKEATYKPLFSKSEALTIKVWDKLKDDPQLPPRKLLGLAISGYLNLVEDGLVKRNTPLSIIDFSLPSSSKRLWIIDLDKGEILHHSLVSHGRNSGDLVAKKFSNINSSFMSSLGFYVTGETYQGKHGYSLRLDGVEKGFNDNARERAIVIHGADYANNDFVQATGRLGRSLGCPALPMALHKDIINTIRGGSCLFIYGNDKSYLNQSPLLNS
jgi:hypothetical protein